jgi:hypothetical protein
MFERNFSNSMTEQLHKEMFNITQSNLKLISNNAILFATLCSHIPKSISHTIPISLPCLQGYRIKHKIHCEQPTDLKQQNFLGNKVQNVKIIPFFLSQLIH